MSEHAHTNYENLLNEGAVLAAKSGLEYRSTPEAEQVRAVRSSSSPEPRVELSISGLNRFSALTIARNLSARLNDEQVDQVSIIRDFEESTDRSKENEPIVFSESPKDGNYAVIVGEEKFGSYVLQADVRGELKRDSPQEGRENLHKQFKLVMDTVEIMPVGGNEEALPEVTGFLKASDRRLRRKKDSRALRRLTRTEEKSDEDEFKKDLREVKFVVALVGLEDAFTAPDVSLVELWRDRKKDATNVIELFLYTYSQMQEANGTKKYYFRTALVNLADTARTNRPFDLRRILEDESVRIFTQDLKISEDDAKGAFELLIDERDKLKLHFIAWLASQPELKAFAVEVKNAVEQKRVQDTTLFREAIKHIVNVGGEHLKARQDPDYPYDLSIGYNADAYSRKREFFKTAWLLSQHLFTKQDIAEFLGLDE